MSYSNNTTLNEIIEQAVSSIEQGNIDAFTQMIKTKPTAMLKAESDRKEIRYRVGSNLITYNGVSKGGKPIQETFGGGVENIENDSVIMKNVEPLKYPEGHPLEGQEVKGYYKSDGKFIASQKIGKTTLFNEYVSDVDWVKRNYGVTATREWQQGFKLEPSYIIPIPETVGNVELLARNIRLTSGDYVVIDTKKGKIDSVHGIEKGCLDRTYTPMAEYIKNVK